MSEIYDFIEVRELGEKLKSIREAKKYTQQFAAEALNIARTTLVAIEKGERKIKFEELQKLCSLCEVSINQILKRQNITVNLSPQFRKLSGTEDIEVKEAAELLNQLVSSEVELEQLLGIQRNFNLPPERPILGGNVSLQAEQDAFELRQWLGLGLNPISDIVNMLELQFGARIYLRPLAHKISGLFAFDSNVGFCMLLNSNHPPERRNHTAAHETGHFISTRTQADIFDNLSDENAREERYANAFSRAFLMPERAVKSRFKEITIGSNSLSRRHVIILANYFSVSREALVRRLEELELVKRGSWDWFEQNGGITNEQASLVLGSEQINKSDLMSVRKISLRMSLMASEALKRNLLSEGQISRLLNLSRVEVREMFDDNNFEESIDNASTKLLI